MRGGIVYITCSPNRTTLYIGVTSDLQGRMHKHQIKHYDNSFSKRYNCVMLVWYKYYDYIEEAITEEKRLKAGNRNPDWKDLWNDVKDLRLY
jgi:putative endonuclease